MREIKFRGIHFATGELVYGVAVSPMIFMCKTEKQFSWIFTITENRNGGGWIKVVAETVGQFIGMKDNNGKDIYEGDRVRCEDVMGNKVHGTVDIIDGCATVVYDIPQYDRHIKCMRPSLYVKCFVVNHALEVIS